MHQMGDWLTASAERAPDDPFLITPAELPLGFGRLNRTDAFGWKGEINHPGYQPVHVKVVVVCSDHAAHLTALCRVSGLSRTISTGVQFRVLLAQRSGCRWLAAW